MDLFPTIFPEFNDVWTANNERIEKFKIYTETHPDVQTIHVKSIDEVVNINTLGFFTVDSQDGQYFSKLNPLRIDGTPIVNSSGVKAVKYSVIEFAYIHGCIPIRIYNILMEKINTLPHIFVYNLLKGQNVYWHPVIEMIQYEDGTLYQDIFKKQQSKSLNADTIYEIIEKLSLPDAGYGGGDIRLAELGDLVGSSWVPIMIVDSRAGYNAVLEDGLFTSIRKILEEVLNTLKSKEGGARKLRKTRRNHITMRQTRKRKSFKKMT